MTLDLINQTINKLEQELKLHYSKEQKQILQYDIKTPCLINACAGSGKTMLLISLMLLRIQSHQNQPKQLLGITFSHDASLDMRARFDKDSHGAKNTPYFSTFHALFFHILRATKVLHNAKVLTSYQPLFITLATHLPKQPKYLTQAQMIQNIFKLRDQVVNQGFTFDGLHLAMNANVKEIREGTKNPKLIFGFQKPDINTSYYDKDVALLEDYHYVVSTYNLYKKKHNMIDFSDMQTLLWKHLQQPSYKEKVKKLMSVFKLVFMDEFQDISTLQWKIMTNILPRTCLEHLTLIGDDDQSIYSFRGSNPSIILNLHRDYPNLHTFNLSTNYRTGGNILKSVRPMITSNHYRLPKKLNTANLGVGHLIEYFSNDKRYSANDVMLKNLVDKIKNPKIPNSDIAILMHFNSSRMLLYDWLANHHVYLTNHTKFILQNNKWYVTALNIALGLITNQLKYIYKVAYYINFGKYQRKMKKYIKKAKQKKWPLTISEYLKHNPKTIFIEQILGSIYVSPNCYLKVYLNLIQAYLKHNQKSVKKILSPSVAAKFQLSVVKPFSALGSLLWMGVHDLTKEHDYVLITSYYVNKDKYKQIIHYIAQQFLKINNVKDFNKFLKESLLRKKNHLSNCKGLHIMSLHQSKGLQFKYVYLYDLSSRIDNPKAIILNYVFPPSITVSGFIEYLINTPLANIKQLEKALYNASTPFEKEHKLTNKSKHKNYKLAFLKLKIKIGMALRTQGVSEIELISKVFNMKFYHNKLQAGIQEQVWQVYHDVLHISMAVEEQRRLIYVGCTRAEQDLYVAYNKNADPLLNELAIPKSAKFYLEPNHQVLNYTDNQKYLKQMTKK